MGESHEGDERDAGGNAKKHSHGARGGGGGLREFDLTAHREIGFLAVATLSQQFGYVALHAFDHFRAGGLDHDRVDVRPTGEPFHVARVGNDHDVVLILAEKIEAFRSEHADDLERNIADADGLADRFAVGEKLVSDGFADHGDLADAANILIGEHGSFSDFPAADIRIIR